MFNRRKYRAMLMAKTDELTPGPIQESQKIKKRQPWFWPVVSLSGSVVVAGVVALSCYAGGLFSSAEGLEGRFIKPTSAKIVDSPAQTMSPSTYRSYVSFAQKFTQIVFDTNRDSAEDKSLAVSLPDAYLCFALTGFISTPDAEGDILSFLNLQNESELKTAAKEIVATLCALKKDSKGRYSGGYNLNSLWFNPDKVSLLPKDDSLYSDLADIFDVSAYQKALTSERANAYLSEAGLPDLPTPTIQLDNDSDPYALAAMSVYYCLDSYEEHDSYEAAYRTGKLRMSYLQNGISSLVDYLLTFTKHCPVYEGAGFCGTTAPIKDLQLSYFLPNAADGSPSSILGDVLGGVYQKKTYQNQSGTTDLYAVKTKAPYFKLNNKIKVGVDALQKELPHISQGGMGERMATSSAGGIAFEGVLQQSVMSYDYNGFYSCSVTIIGAEAVSFPDEEIYDFTLDHPYLFEVSRPAISVAGVEQSLPLVIGQIIDPGYNA